QWNGACGRDGEGRGLSGNDGFADRLSRDRRWSIHGQGSCVARDGSGRIADSHSELRSIIRAGGGRGRVARGSCTTDGRAVLVPLIAQRRGPAGGDRETCRLTHGDRLVDRLRTGGRQG